MTNPLHVLPQHLDHPRTYSDNRYVYPVLSRRSRGISIGVNLNPDKACNFDCIYCQVDRTSPAVITEIDPARLLVELEATIGWVQDGSLFEQPEFEGIPQELRAVRDIAFSGDGEPTAAREFGDLARQVLDLRDRLGLRVPLVVITNATLFQRPAVLDTLDEIMRRGGSIWAKLDAGTEPYYKTIERTVVPLQRVLDNLLLVARRYPIVIQSLFLRLEGQPPTTEEIAAYVGRLEDVLAGGGRIALVQVYTVARRPAEATVTPLLPSEVDRIADAVRTLGVPVEAYYGPSS